MPYITREDIQQEIALAILLGKSPKQAAYNERRKIRKDRKREKTFSDVYGEDWRRFI